MKNSRILVADDDGCVRKAMRARLSSMGFEVVDASDGLGVLAQYIPRGVDAMILDYDMPNGDGQTVARMIRKESDVPIVFVSGYSADVFRSIVTQLPDVYYLKKPVDAQKLSALLDTVLETDGGHEAVHATEAR